MAGSTGSSGPTVDLEEERERFEEEWSCLQKDGSALVEWSTKVRGGKVPSPIEARAWERAIKL